MILNIIFRGAGRDPIDSIMHKLNSPLGEYVPIVMVPFLSVAIVAV